MPLLRCRLLPEAVKIGVLGVVAEQIDLRVGCTERKFGLPQQASIGELGMMARVDVESVVPAADGGTAIVIAPSGNARAYLEVLNDGTRSLVMYNTAGDVYVEDLRSSASLDALKFHLKAKELASAY